MSVSVLSCQSGVSASCPPFPDKEVTSNPEMTSPVVVTPTPVLNNIPLIPIHSTREALIPDLAPASKPVGGTTTKKKKSKNKSQQEKSSQGSQGENTGRWTAEEHRLFLQGLEEHGKGWKKIASLIKSRTVVQIRTHAQKYFQKLAKARQNGEEGDVSMEGRGVSVNVPPVAPVSTNPTHMIKARKHDNGTKRKGISDVVASVHRDFKKDGILISPVLTPYLEKADDTSQSGLEDSLYRFLTPAGSYAQHDASATETIIDGKQTPTGPTIVLPSKDVLVCEGSPTTVINFNYPFKEAEPPQWYAKGSDVDELLNEADALDWLADPGEVAESFPIIVPTQNLAVEAKPNPPEHKADDEVVVSAKPDQHLPPVVSSCSISMNELPSLFDSSDHLSNKRLKLSTNTLFASHDAAAENSGVEKDDFSFLDTSFDEQAFVSALLDSNDNALSVLS